MSNIIVEVKGINKTFGVVQALSNVSFTINAGEIRGLIGENGSGKSTVSSIIAGMQSADSGEMELMGKTYKPISMVDAQRQGVSMIVQEIGTVVGTSVAHNIFAAREKQFKQGAFVNRKEMHRQAQKCLDDIGLNYIKAEAHISSISFEDRKLVEISRAMLDKPKLLIVDETTTALSQGGREILYSLMNRIAGEGGAVLFISHDLEELMERCTVLTVLRDGHIIDHLTKEQMEPRLIKNLMVGRELSDKYYREDYGENLAGEVVMRAVNVSSALNIENFNLELHSGEILGIAGLSNHEVGRLLFGAEKPITGYVELVKQGKRVTSISDSIQSGVGYVSKNRDEEVLVLNDSIKRNLTISAWHKLRRFGLISRRSERTFAKEQVSSLEIKCWGADQDVYTLSGGNKQKVSFGKWIGNKSDILILDCPTRGVDVAVKATMYQLMDDLRKEGKAIVLISEEMAEIIGMADRILVIKDGRLTKEFFRDPKLNEHDVIEYMI